MVYPGVGVHSSTLLQTCPWLSGPCSIPMSSLFHAGVGDGSPEPCMVPDRQPTAALCAHAWVEAHPSHPAAGTTRHLLSLLHQLAVGGTGRAVPVGAQVRHGVQDPDAWTNCKLPRYGNSKFFPAGISTDAHDAFGGSSSACECCPSPCSAAGLCRFAVSRRAVVVSLLCSVPAALSVACRSVSSWTTFWPGSPSSSCRKILSGS